MAFDLTNEQRPLARAYSNLFFCLFVWQRVRVYYFHLAHFTSHISASQFKIAVFRQNNRYVHNVWRFFFLYLVLLLLRVRRTLNNKLLLAFYVVAHIFQFENHFPFALFFSLVRPLIDQRRFTHT